MSRLLAFLQNLSKRNIAFFGFLAAALSVLYLTIVFVPQAARERVQIMLAEAGFKKSYITDLSVGPTGWTARNVKLDSYGLDEVKTIDARLNWFTFLTTGNLSSLTINGMIVSLDSDTLSLTAQRLFQNLLNLPYYTINLNDVTIDMATPYGNLRVTAEAHMNTAADGKNRDIKARITGSQYQLGFDSAWQGVLKDDGRLEMSANILDGRVNFGQLRISRFNGWLAMDAAKADYSLQSQLEAGSATFMGLPIQAISLTNEHTLGSSNVIARAGVSGMPDVSIAADFIHNKKQNSFAVVLKGDNLGALLSRAEKQSTRNKPVPSALADAKSFEIKADYQPEQRFTSGPLPFILSAVTDGKKAAGGNILIYPDTMDVRGSLETNPAMVPALKKYFGIAPDKISEDFIRVEANAKKLFKPEDRSKEKVSEK